MTGIWFVLLLGQAFALPPLAQVQELSLCAEGIIPRCLHLVREGTGAREILDAYTKRDTKISAAEFEKKVRGILDNVKKTKNDRSACEVNFKITAKVAGEPSNGVLCAEDYSKQEWLAWAKLLR